MAEGYIICRGLDDLETWKAEIKTKYGWSALVAQTQLICQFGSVILCYSEGT